MENLKLMEYVLGYLEGLSLPTLEIENAKEACFIKLSNVNIIKKNRTRGASNQTHIHVTGGAMNVFFKPTFIKNSTSSTTDEHITLRMFSKNFADIKKKFTGIETKYQKENDTTIKLQTVKKVSYRATGHQVQLSKGQFDSENFKDLRNFLFEDDLLCFFRLDESYSNFFIVAIATGTSDVIKNLPTQTHLKIPNNTFTLHPVSADNIVSVTKKYSEDTNYDIDIDKQISAIKTRQKKTVLHEEIVKKIAVKLNSNNITLHAGNIDCLAVEDTKLAYLFEIKTLSSTIDVSEEKDQVRKAFSQLFYYDFFAKAQFNDIPTFKIAVFSRKISDEHINFFNTHSCEVLWLNEENDFISNNSSLQNLFN